tara:strand:- start:422 stop:640 length:219 start_codon:yes stop_codon:yes gene_type:complete
MYSYTLVTANLKYGYSHRQPFEDKVSVIEHFENMKYDKNFIDMLFKTGFRSVETYDKAPHVDFHLIELKEYR